jgi:peptide-methionine (S)-S-oxide reductase
MCFFHKSYNTNQQGPDKGSSYRSIAFYKMQLRKIIEDKIKNLIKYCKSYCYRGKTSYGLYAAEVTTKIMLKLIPISLMWKAFQYHDTTSLKNI